MVITISAISNSSSCRLLQRCNDSNYNNNEVHNTFSNKNENNNNDNYKINFSNDNNTKKNMIIIKTTPMIMITTR